MCHASDGRRDTACVAASAGRRREAASVALVVLAALLLAAGGTLFYIKKEIAPERPFAARLVSSLDDPAVRDVVAQRTVDGLITGPASDLLAFRPLLLIAVDRVVLTDAF